MSKTKVDELIDEAVKADPIYQADCEEIDSTINPTKGFMFYYDWYDAIGNLTDSEFGKLIKALLRFAQSGEVPEDLPSNSLVAFNFMYPQIERDKEKYDDTIKKRKKSAAFHSAKSRLLKSGCAYSSCEEAE